MNGRMYDANLGRFLSPDNHIQEPFYSQSYNRYGYVWNNPLSYVDPSGEFFYTAMIVGAIIGGYIGGAKANGGELNPTKWKANWDTVRGVLGGAAVGTIAGAGIATVAGATLPAWAGPQGLGLTASVGWVSSMGSIAFAGNQIDGVDFRWTTSAGGEGTVPISDGGNDSSGVKGGGNAKVYIETDGIGHAYIGVNGAVFSYGRYNGSYSSSSGAFGPVGEGVLYKNTGAAARAFIAERTGKFPTNVYSFSLDANATYNFFNDAYNAGSYNTQDSRVIDTYFLLGNNCATVVCGGLRSGGYSIPSIQTPGGFVNWMNKINRIGNGWNPGLPQYGEPKY